MKQCEPSDDSAKVLKVAVAILSAHQGTFNIGNAASLGDENIKEFVLRVINDTNFNFQLSLDCLLRIKDREQCRVCVIELAKRLAQIPEETLPREAQKQLECFVENSSIVKGRWFEFNMSNDLLLSIGDICRKSVEQQDVKKITPVVEHNSPEKTADLGKKDSNGGIPLQAVTGTVVLKNTSESYDTSSAQIDLELLAIVDGLVVPNDTTFMRQHTIPSGVPVSASSQSDVKEDRLLPS